MRRAGASTAYYGHTAGKLNSYARWRSLAARSAALARPPSANVKSQRCRYCGDCALTVTDTFSCSSIPPIRRPRTGAAAS
ncbi:MAG: hypothetical protein QOC89_3561 [Paraburkholderia sp.]|nr:hypothetical protein [Paraburkholderia sp.]MEA3128411.1 hypothetical protein [Paraburkholderia sp.]